jgi:hypothetical protein
VGANALKAVYERSSRCQIVEGEKRTERVAEDLEKLEEGQGGIQGNNRDRVRLRR